AIEEFSDLGSGFNIAMRDLDIRGSGNLLGGEQSGFIAEIGFEMYNKILDEAIHELKDAEFKDLFKDEPQRAYVNFTQVDTDLEIHFPDYYITSIAERYNLYTELSKVENKAQLLAFEQQIKDRFGPIPQPVKIMFKVLQLQWIGKQLGFEKLSYKKGVVRGYFVTDKQSPFFDSEIFTKILMFAQQHPRLCNLKEIKDTLRIAFENVNTIDEAIELLQMVQ
ncbi:MAG: transcription-repair coupling factor, partial [Sphingobacteriaceae bacterium]|nr:transcription-repair coupling factor [Sphingobacteriaceae bacterium]